MKVVIFSTCIVDLFFPERRGSNGRSIGTLWL